MRVEIAVLVVLALATQLFLAARHGFEPVEDGLQIASAGTLVLLVFRVANARLRRRRELVLQILDELGQPLTVFHGYLSMVADGTLPSLNGKLELLEGKCDDMRRIVRKLVDVIRESG